MASPPAVPQRRPILDAQQPRLGGIPLVPPSSPQFRISSPTIELSPVHSVSEQGAVRSQIPANGNEAKATGQDKVQNTMDRNQSSAPGTMYK